MTDTIDHEGLRRRYRAERDKRLRPDGFTKTYARNGRVCVAAPRPALAAQADN